MEDCSEYHDKCLIAEEYLNCRISIPEFKLDKITETAIE